MAKDIADQSSQILDRLWKDITTLAQQGQLKDWIDDESLRESMRCAVNSRTKTYRYDCPPRSWRS